MTKNLIVSVGGSKAPILTSVKQIKPKHIVFLCSDDREGTKGSYKEIWDERDDQRMEGKEVKESSPPKPCETCSNVPRWNNEPTIATQLNLPQERFDIVKVANPDNIQDCYSAAEAGIQLLLSKEPSLPIIADYTGGTKTMSHGLISASMDNGQIEIMVVAGKRRDLVKVADGTQRVTNSNWKGQMIQRQIQQMKKCIAEYQYEACIEIGNQISPQVTVGSEENDEVQFYATVAEGLRAWDLFDYQKAREILGYCGSSMGPLLGGVGKIINNLDAMKNMNHQIKDPKKVSMALLFDLMRNAERKMMQEKYDDAVARVYRSLELMAQIALRYQKPSIITAEVPLEYMPESFIQQQDYSKEEKAVAIGLITSYELLQAQDHPVGRVYIEKKNRLLDLLTNRNHSFMAHGYEPFTEKGAKAFYDFMLQFVNDVLDALKKDGYKLDIDAFEKSPIFPLEIEKK